MMIDLRMGGWLMACDVFHYEVVMLLQPLMFDGEGI